MQPPTRSRTIIITEKRHARPSRPISRCDRPDCALLALVALAGAALVRCGRRGCIAGPALRRPRGRRRLRATARGRACACPRARAPRRVKRVRTRVLRLAPGESVAAALRRLRAQQRRRVGGARLHAHTSRERSTPTTRATAARRTGWQQLQWNFTGEFGVNAPEAWYNVAADGAPGGKGVVVAVLDTGVAYANRGRFRRSPDFGRFQFVQRLRLRRARPLPQRPQRARHVRGGDDRRGHQQRTTGSPGSRTARASCRCACSTPRAKAKRRRSPKACASRSATARG